jgi:putative ABC transport system permease protein
MTLTRFVTKSAFRNKRRSFLTVVSITFSLVLLTLMMTVWHSWYVDKGSSESAQRLITRHRVSLTQTLPIYYREKMRAVPGVVAVAPTQWFGGLYKDEKPDNFFAQFATDPEEIFKVVTDFKIPDDQLAAWQKDQAGVVVDSELAKKFGWKIGDRISIKGTIFPATLELTIRGVFTAPQPSITVYFNRKYLEEAVGFFKGKSGTFNILADSPEDVPKVAAGIDAMFRNSPEPTKTESEKAFQLSFINSIGNAWRWYLQRCWYLPTRWRCRFVNARAKLRC